MALSYLFHSYPVHILYGNQAILSLFSSHLPRQVLYFCFFEEEDRKIIKKGLPFFLAFLWIVGVPVDVNVTDSLSVFCPFCPPLTLVFPLVKSMYGQKKVRKLVEILSVTCLLCIFWTDQITLVWPFKSKRMLIC